MSQGWFYQVAGKARAASADELREMHSSGAIDDATLVWQASLAGWEPFSRSGLCAVPNSEPSVMEPPYVDPAGRVEPVFAPVGAPMEASPPPLAVNDDGWQDTHPRPWRRYFARMIDITLLGAALGMVLGLVVSALSPELFEVLFVKVLGYHSLVDAFFSILLVIPVLAVLVGLFGTSPGKWLMGVRIMGRDGRPIGLRAGFKREMSVYVRGLGLGLPLVSLFTLISAHSRLKDDGVSHWDERKPWVVTHRPDGARQTILAVCAVVLWLAVRITLQSME